MLLISDFQKRK